MFSLCSDTESPAGARDDRVLPVELDDRWYIVIEKPTLEVTVEGESEQLEAPATGEAAEVVVSVVDVNGDPVTREASVVATQGTARLEGGVISSEAGAVSDDLEGSDDDLEDHQAVLAFVDKQPLASDQDRGTIFLDIVVPNDSYDTDEAPNPDLRVVGSADNSM